MTRYKLLRDLVGAKGLKFPAFFVVEPCGEQWPERRCLNMVKKGFMAKTEESATQLGAPEAAPGPAPGGNPDGDKNKAGNKGKGDKPK